MGDKPAWMKIKAYKAEGRKAELILSLGKKKKDYWFPVTPNVYERFQDFIGRSRYWGLRYLQAYIRTYREYAEVWPSKRYTKKNRLKKNSLLSESALASTVLRMFEEGQSISAIASQTMLPESLVERFLQVSGKLAGN